MNGSSKVSSLAKITLVNPQNTFGKYGPAKGVSTRKLPIFTSTDKFHDKWQNVIARAFSEAIFL